MKKKLDKERVIAAIGWGESKAEKFDRDTQVISVEYLKRELEKISDTEVEDEAKEPEKVVVPRFVAEWYEQNKEDLDYAIFDVNVTMNEKYKQDRPLSDIEFWFDHRPNAPIKTVINMINGYEVEEV